MTGLTEEQLDGLLDELEAQILYAQAAFGPYYAGRLYYCEPCWGLHAICAPADELIDAYPCEHCKRPQKPLTPIGVPRRMPNRAERRHPARA